MTSLPYAVAAADYLSAGWSPIPLPHKEKSPPPDDYTGAAGIWVDERRVKEWTRDSRPRRAKAGNLLFTPGNIALRLPKTVLGIDVDMYDGKAGAASLDAALEAFGPLPPTWISTARADGSGIRYYTIPEGLSWPGQVGPGIELIRWDHRFAVVAPSIHPKLLTSYLWLGPDGSQVVDEIPAADDFPALPDKWVKGLTNGAVWVEREVASMTAQQVRDWLGARNTEGCSVMAATLTRYSRAIREAGEDGGAHEVARNGAWALIGDAAAGHGGVTDALARMKRVFKSAVKGRRGKEVDSEWARIVIRGVQKVVAEGDPDPDDICALLGSPTAGPPGAAASDGLSGSTTGRSSSAFEYVRDDIGNAQRLARRLGPDGKYVAAYGAWAIYDGSTGLWGIDPHGAAIHQAAFAMVRDMEEEAKFIEDPKAQAAFIAFVRSSGNMGRIAAAIGAASRLRGMSLAAEAFDADPSILVCPNGVLELGENGLGWRSVRHGDYATYSTAVPYVAGARSEVWEAFLNRVLPDVLDQVWVQTLAGYSLLGHNPERVLVLAKGPTTSGKTTFAETLIRALGGYASTFNLSLFREKQDEAPRADIVDVLPRRFIVASEASHEWRLHGDAVKRFTGGEAIRARQGHSNAFVARAPAFTPWLTTNSTPNVPGADAALLRRLVGAPFGQQLDPAEVRPRLWEELHAPEALTAVLAWAAAGWERYCEDGLLEPSPNSMHLLWEAREEISDVSQALAEIGEAAAEYEEDAGALYRAYEMWSEQNGDERSKLSANAFGRTLTGLGYGRELRTVPHTNSTKKFRVRTGIRLREEWRKLVS